jgi:hypothetical protein
MCSNKQWQWRRRRWHNKMMVERRQRRWHNMWMVEMGLEKTKATHTQTKA